MRRSVGISGVALVVAAFLVGGGGCKSGPEAKSDSHAVKKKGQAEYTGPTSDPNAVTPETLEQIDMFFRRSAPHLQYECYDPEVERTHKKYEGNLSFSLIVQKGGKASDIKLIGSTLHALDESKEVPQGIVDCVAKNLGEWEWPDVNAPAPYTPSINFKPAW